EQAGLAHLAEDRRIGTLVAEGLQHPRRQLVGGELRSAVTHHALFLGQLLVEQQRVDPVEACVAGHGGSSLSRGPLLAPAGWKDPRRYLHHRQTTISQRSVRFPHSRIS